MNSVNITGRVTRDIELRQSTNGTSVCSFYVAVKRPHSAESYFFKCVAWRKTAENLCRFVGKGDMVGITGYIYTRKYTDNSGNEREVVEISADDVTFLSKKTQNTENPNNSASDMDGFEDFEDFGEVNEDDLPF